MSNTPVTPTPDQMQPPAGTPPTGTPPAQAPSGVGSAITGQPAGQPPTAQPNAAPTTPTTTTPQPNTPAPAQANPVDDHAKLYTKFLRQLTPPTTYIDPQGNVQTLKQNAPSMGKTILSAVLAGMFAPTVYRQGAYGPQVDSLATAGAAYNAGQGVIAKQNAAAQAQSDLEAKNLADSQTRMLGVAKSNVEMMHLYAATMADMGKSAQNQVDNFAPTLQIAKDHDEHLQPGDTKAVLASGITMNEALKHPEFKDAMLKHSIVPDGIVYIDDDQGHQIPTQTWTIIDPNVKVSLDAPSVAIVSQINPQWKDAFDATNGNMQIQLGKIQQVTQQVNSVQHAERLFTDAANSDDKMIQGLGLKGDINGEIMSAVRQGTPGARQALQALMAMENAGASQGTLADALNRLITDKDHAAGARYILDALGTTPEKAEKYIREDQRERARQDAADKEAGKIDLKETPKPQTPQEAATLEHTKLENTKLSNDLATAAKVGDTTKTGAEYLATLSPQDQAQLKAVHEGRQGLSDRQLATKDGKILSQKLNAAYPDFDATKYPAYNKLRTNITSGPMSVGINRFNTALQHLATMDSHVNAWSTIPGLKSVDALVGGDAANLEADRTAVKSELAAAYKGGVASEGEVNDWSKMLDVASPYELKAKIKELGKLLQGKLTSYQNQWDNGAPRDVVTPVRIISPEGRAAYKKITGETLPQVRGDVQTAKNGETFTFDGTQWVKKVGQ